MNPPARRFSASPREPNPWTAPGIGPSFARIYGLWLRSWDTALAALSAASQAGTLGTNDSAVHKAVIASERGVVITQLTLLGQSQPR